MQQDKYLSKITQVYGYFVLLSSSKCLSSLISNKVKRRRPFFSPYSVPTVESFICFTSNWMCPILGYSHFQKKDSRILLYIWWGWIIHEMDYLRQQQLVISHWTYYCSLQAFLNNNSEMRSRLFMKCLRNTRSRKLTMYIFRKSAGLNKSSLEDSVTSPANKMIIGKTKLL